MMLKFKTLSRSEADEWTTEGSSIVEPEKLGAIRHALERGPVIVEHRHYRGSRAPDRLVFDDYDELTEYLEARAVAGDSLFVWAYDEVCTLDRRLVEGKCPAEDGTVPRGGAY